MKIIFICGSLEPGKDGVGDYTRKLAGELVKQKFAVGAVALNDGFGNRHKYFEYQDSAPFPVLRLGTSMPLKKRFQYAKEWINQQDPDWLSLQFVPFSFQKKGLPWFLGARLKALGRGRKWQIMFHELWVGMDTGATMKSKLHGWAQKQIIANVIYSLAPRKIHTQTRLYQEYLNSMGKNIAHLPLFSNINLKRQSSGFVNNSIEIAVFGNLHSQAKLNEFISWLQREKTFFQFHFLGDNGSEKKKWIKILVENKIPYKDYGWLPEQKLSQTLANCNLAITSTPYFLVEKSGSVAAMLEHNLKVICIACEWIPRGKVSTPINGKVTQWNKKMHLNQIVDQEVESRGSKLQKIAKKFVLDIQTS